MSVQSICAQCRSVGILPISRFVSEDTLRLKESYSVAFAIAEENKPHTTGSDLSNSTMARFLRCFRDPIRVPRVKNRVPTIRKLSLAP